MSTTEIMPGRSQKQCHMLIRANSQANAFDWSSVDPAVLWVPQALSLAKVLLGRGIWTKREDLGSP